MKDFWHEVEKKYNTFEFIDFDVDDFPEKKEKFEIKDIPTFLILKDGMAMEKLEGIKNKNEILAILDKYI